MLLLSDRHVKLFLEYLYIGSQILFGDCFSRPLAQLGITLYHGYALVRNIKYISLRK